MISGGIERTPSVGTGVGTADGVSYGTAVDEGSTGDCVTNCGRDCERVFTDCKNVRRRFKVLFFL